MRNGTQASPYAVSHKAGTGPANQTIAGMRFDEYGHLSSYTKPSSAGTVNGIVGKNGVKSETDTATGIATVELQEIAEAGTGTWRFGGFDATVDDYGRITAVDQMTSITGGERYFGAQLVTLTDSGSIADVVDTTADRFVVYHKASKRFTNGDSSITFTTALVGSFRVTLYAASVTAASVSIDSRSVATDVVGSACACALSEERYALGQHTVSVSGTFSSSGYLDVEIVTRY